VISGHVVVGRGPIVQLVLLDARGNAHSTSAVVDTGFTGSLTLPPSVVAALRLLWHKESEGILADGSTTLLDVYKANVSWYEQPKVIHVHELDSEPTIGMRLLQGFRFTMETIGGGEVRIEPL
jgi:clan AA aspartic protease